MNLSNILAIMDGSQKYDFGNGAIVCLVAVLIVFSVLLVIIAASALVSKLIERFVKEEAKPVLQSKPVVNNNSVAIDINDEDMMAAILVATIDYRNEVKEDVKVINVREVK